MCVGTNVLHLQIQPYAKILKCCKSDFSLKTFGITFVQLRTRVSENEHLTHAVSTQIFLIEILSQNARIKLFSWAKVTFMLRLYFIRPIFKN